MTDERIVGELTRIYKVYQETMVIRHQKLYLKTCGWVRINENCLLYFHYNQIKNIWMETAIQLYLCITDVRKALMTSSSVEIQGDKSTT